MGMPIKARAFYECLAFSLPLSVLAISCTVSSQNLILPFSHSKHELMKSVRFEIKLTVFN